MNIVKDKNVTRPKTRTLNKKTLRPRKDVKLCTGIERWLDKKQKISTRDEGKSCEPA